MQNNHFTKFPSLKDAAKWIVKNDTQRITGYRILYQPARETEPITPSCWKVERQMIQPVTKDLVWTVV
jgi:hypothetical protein